MIDPIFAHRSAPSGLAHGVGHRVPGTTLPPGDANVPIFHCDSQVSWGYEEGLPASTLGVGGPLVVSAATYIHMGTRHYFGRASSNDVNSLRYKQGHSRFHARLLTFLS